MRRPFAATLAALLTIAVVAGCTPTPTPTPDYTPPPVPIATVDPHAVAKALPDDPSAYDTSEGAKKAPVDVPNGAPVDPPAVAQDVQVVVPPQDGLGGKPVEYARLSPKGTQSRFTAEQAVAVAVREAQHPSGINWHNRCEGFAGGYVWGFSSSGWYSARTALYGLPSASRHLLKSWNDAPPGALVYWPHPPYGHATISIGDGKIASTDILIDGRVSLVPIELVADRWFGGEKPYWIDPISFPNAVGNNGLKAPLPVPAPGPKQVYTIVRHRHTVRFVARSRHVGTGKLCKLNPELHNCRAGKVIHKVPRKLRIA